MRRAAGPGFATTPFDALHLIAPDRACIVFVESPATSLAAAMAANDGLAIDDWLAAWLEGAQRLLQFIQRRPQLCLVVSAGAAWAAPAEFMSACRRRLGNQPALTLAPEAADAAVDPLAAAIAEGIVAGERALRAVAAELALCCAPLGGTTEQAPQRAAAQQRLRALRAGVKEAATLRETLVRTQVELEDHFLAKQATAAALGVAQAEAAQLAKAKQAAVDAASTLKRQIEEAARAVQAQAAQSGEIAQAAEAVLREKFQLDIQVRQLREEIEQYCQAYVKLESAGRPAAAASFGPTLNVRDARIAWRRDEDPHRECAFEFGGVTQGEDVFEVLRVRLVEHHGNAGIVLVGEDGKPAILHGWRESGRDDGTPYVLIVPSDDSGREALGAHDWRRLLALVAHVERAVIDLGAGERWIQVARRLGQQLAALPMRLRFDELSTPADGAARTFAWRMSDAHCGTVVPGGALSLRWRVDGADGARSWLEIDAGEGASLWPSWPREPDGQPVARLILPLGDAAADPAARATWQRLSPSDRDAAFAVVRTLPTLLAARSDWPSWAARDVLLAGASALHERTARHWQASPLRRAMRVLRGRDLAA